MIGRFGTHVPKTTTGSFNTLTDLSLPFSLSWEDDGLDRHAAYRFINLAHNRMSKIINDLQKKTIYVIYRLCIKL